MSKHTPGPWVVSTLNLRIEETDRDFYVDGDRYEVYDDETDEHEGMAATSVAIVIGSRSVPAVQANVRLIAASPDLLAACEAALDQGWAIAWRQIQSAVAKAKGDDA